MAALFQIRRGASGSLSNGELYYNQTSQSLQLGSNTGSIITLAKLNEYNSGSFELSGSLIVSGNTTIIGNLTFGSTSSIQDTVTLLSEVSSSMIPYLDNTFDLGFSGSQNKWWKTLYVNTVSASVLSGSFAGVGNLEIFSQSVDSRLDYLEGPLSTSVDLRLDRMEASSSLYDNAMSGSNRLYVSPSGSDTNTGLEPHTPFKTIKAAVASLGSATAGNIKRYTIYVGSGNYTEQNPIAVPPGVAIVGDTLRTVRLTAANPTKDFFHTHDANYFYGLRFLDLQYPAFAFSFPASTAKATISGNSVSAISLVHSLSGYTDGNNQDLGIIIEGPDNSGSAATATANVSGGIITQINVVSGGTNYSATEKPHISIPAPSAQRPVITTSPYVQNCSSITGPFNTSGVKIPITTALPYDITALQVDEQGAGGGIRIDGNLVSGLSPLESFVADAFTQVNQGGPGHLVINKGYAQFVSCFTTFCTYGFKTANGGFANISNSVIDFGKYGLISKRYFPTTYNSGSSLETKTSQVSGVIFSDRGAGYTGSTVPVQFNDGGYAVRATGYATINNDTSLADIVITNPGSGYTSRPTVQIDTPTAIGNRPAAIQGGKALITGVAEMLMSLESGSRGIDISSNMILNGVDYLVTDVAAVSGQPNQRRVTTYPAPPSIAITDVNIKFHQLSNISTGGLVMEYVGSGVTYNALPKYGGVPIRTREVNEFVPGKVFYTTVDNIGNLKIGQFFAVNQLTGEVTINANSFNLSGLNAIGPFKRNGAAVGVVLQEVSNNTTLLNSQGLFGEDTVPTQYAVKGYIDVISASFDSRTDNLELTASSNKNRINNLESISSSYNSYTQSTNNFTASVTQSLNAIHSYTSSLKNAFTASGQNVTIYGNLTVQGTQTAIESTTLNVKDINITLASGSTNSGAANGAGINIDGANVTMSWSDANQRIELNKDFAVTGSISSSTLVGVGNVTLFSASISASIENLNNTSASLYNFSASQYNSDSSSFNTRITANSASAWGAFQSASSYSGSLATSISASKAAATSYSSSLATTISASKAEYTSFSASNASTDNTQTTNITAASASAWGAFQSASTYSGSFYTTINNTTSSVANISTSVGLLQTFSSSQYNSDSSSFNTRITNTSSSLYLLSGSYITDSSSFDTRIDALQIIGDFVSSGSAVLQYTTAGTLGNILVKGDTPKSIHVIDTITFTGITETAGTASHATGLLMTGSITASTGFSGSSISVGTIIANDITASGNLYVSGTIYTYELHTIIESSSIIRTSGSTFIGDQQSDVLTITGSLYQTGSTSFSELTGSLASFSSSLDSRIGTTNVGTLSASIYQTDATQSNNITIVSASTWGAFQSASSYSGSFYTTLNTMAGNITTAQNSANGAYASASAYSASSYTRDANQDTNTTQASASAWGAFQSASSYSSSFYTTINNVSSSLTNVSASANGAFASASTYSSSFYTTINTISSSLTTTSASAAGAFASASSYSSSLSSSISASTAIATGYSASAFTAYAKVGAANTFTQNQIISGSLSVTGDVTAYATSDERLKDNIQLISNPIQKVEQLRGVEFDWKDGMPKAGQHDYGVIAQDVIKVMPELVNQRPDGYYAVDYDKIIGLLIEVVKEQEKRIKDLENKVGS